MKRLLASLLAAAAFAVGAAPDGDDAFEARERVERERISVERRALEAKFAEEHKACYARFAVNDCVERARRVRDEGMTQLRRQELVLNDEARRRKAAQRQLELDERTSAARQQQAAARRAQAVQEQRERQEAAQRKAQQRQADARERARGQPAPASTAASTGTEPPALPSGKVPRKAGDQPTAAEVARNRAAHEERLREAAEHKREVQQRAAQRATPPASDLPVPP